MPIHNRDDLLQKLSALQARLTNGELTADAYTDKLTEVFRESIEHPTLKERKDHIAFGREVANIDPDKWFYGFKMTDRPYMFLSTMLSALSRSSVPDDVAFRDYFPDMTQEQWEVAMLACSRILTMFEFYADMDIADNSAGEPDNSS